MDTLKGQLTLRGIAIGSIGCIVITAASIYTALKLGALPWPIVFAALISLFFLKAFGRGKSNLNEANVTHTIMSAGAMVAGGLAFTIPGIWILGLSDEISLIDMTIIALAGVALGLAFTARIRKQFIEKEPLCFPIGQAAAQALKAGNAGGKVGIKLFSSLGIAGIYTALRDLAGLLPSMLLTNISIPGVAFGIFNSPMLLAVGFLVGTGAVLVWFAGALFANFGIMVGGTNLGFWDVSFASQIVSSLGMGCMMGAGFGVVIKNGVAPFIVRFFMKKENEESTSKTVEKPAAKRMVGAAALLLSIVVLLLSFALQLGPLPSIVLVGLTWVTCTMSAQSVGQTGIDPMEIFGLIALLIIAGFSPLPQVQLFFIAAVVAVACGLAGDIMNDFKAGAVLGTSSQAQWLGQAIGGIIGALISVCILTLLVNAYGPEAFGAGKLFVSAQASVVATAISGIPCPEAFLIGLIGGCVLYYLGIPSMMLGLGIYLPFYLSISAFIGCLIKLGYQAIATLRLKNKSETEKEALKESQEETGLIVASGILAGESIVGVISALIILGSGVATL